MTGQKFHSDQNYKHPLTMHTEPLRVRDLIEYLKREDPDAKVTASGVRVLWDAPKRCDKGCVDLTIEHSLTDQEVFKYADEWAKMLDRYAFELIAVDVDDEDEFEGIIEGIREIATELSNLADHSSP